MIIKVLGSALNSRSPCWGKNNVMVTTLIGNADQHNVNEDGQFVMALLTSLSRKSYTYQWVESRAHGRYHDTYKAKLTRSAHVQIRIFQLAGIYLSDTMKVRLSRRGEKRSTPGRLPQQLSRRVRVRRT